MKAYSFLRSAGLNVLLFLVVVGWVLAKSANGQAIKKYYITVADSKIYVEDSGQGPSILLLHGGLLDHRMWQKQVSELNQHFRVLNCDMRKHGMTRDGDSTFLNSTALKLILDSLGIAKSHVMGLSLGAVAATDFVLAHPERVDKLILAAPGLIGYDLNHDPALVFNNQQIEKSYQRKDTATYVEYFLRSWTDGPHRSPKTVDQNLRAQVKSMISDNLKQHRWSVGLGFTENPPPISELATIQSPTLVLVGDQDMADILTISEILHQKIPRVKKIMIAGAAHMLNLEKPDPFNQAIKAFLGPN